MSDCGWALKDPKLGLGHSLFAGSQAMHHSLTGKSRSARRSCRRWVDSLAPMRLRSCCWTDPRACGKVERVSNVQRGAPSCSIPGRSTTRRSLQDPLATSRPPPRLHIAPSCGQSAAPRCLAVPAESSIVDLATDIPADCAPTADPATNLAAPRTAFADPAVDQTADPSRPILASCKTGAVVFVDPTRTVVVALNPAVPGPTISAVHVWVDLAGP